MSVEIKVTIEVSPIASKIIKNLNETLAKSPTGVSFVKLNGYENSNNEISNNLVNVGQSYEKAVLNDIATLEALDVTTIENRKSDVVTLYQAKIALIEAFKKPSVARSNGQKNAYTHIPNCKGLKIHNETGVAYLYAFCEKKEVIVEGVYPHVNSSALTIAKNELRKKFCKTAKFKNYIINNIDQMKLNGTTIEI